MHTHSDEGRPPDAERPPWWRSRAGVVFFGFFLVAAFYLLNEHTAHVFGLLPYLLLLACPLMHLLMPHGHGGHGKRRSDKNAGDPAP
jgi:peptidoglycan/LPS O-acetylase OafA/YrhL